MYVCMYVYDCKLVYDNFEAVWKKFQSYSAHLELFKNQSLYCNRKITVYRKFWYIGIRYAETVVPIYQY